MKKTISTLLIIALFTGCYSSSSPTEEEKEKLTELGNSAPTAISKRVTLDEDTPTKISLSGTDPDSNKLKFISIKAPIHGIYDGDVYTPDRNYDGNDSFTFKVNDGKLDSAPATVYITINNKNDKPIANRRDITVKEKKKQKIILSGSDSDDEPLTYHIVQKPIHGKLIGSDKNLTYIPNQRYFKNDSFTFKVNDGIEDSEVSDVNLTIVGYRMINKLVYFSDNENIDKNITYTYDENGTLLSQLTDRDGDGTIEENITYVYDKNGVVLINNKFLSRDNYTLIANKYDENGSLISKQVNYDNDDQIDAFFTYTYDENRNLLLVNWTDSLDKPYIKIIDYIYTYDKKGNILTYGIDNGMPGGGKPDGRINTQYTYKYDENSTLISEKMVTHEDGRFPYNFTFEYTYDEAKNILTKVYKLEDGSIYKTDFYTWIEL